jgi:hypothetical protein
MQNRFQRMGDELPYFHLIIKTVGKKFRMPAKIVQ